MSNHRGGVIHVKFAKGGIWLKHMQVVLLKKQNTIRDPKTKIEKKLYLSMSFTQSGSILILHYTQAAVEITITEKTAATSLGLDVVGP